MATAAEMSHAVSIHVWPTASAPMSAPIVESTGMMSDWRLATAVKLVATAMKVMRVGDINAFPEERGGECESGVGSAKRARDGESDDPRGARMEGVSDRRPPPDSVTEGASTLQVRVAE